MDYDTSLCDEADDLSFFSLFFSTKKKAIKNTENKKQCNQIQFLKAMHVGS